MAEDSRRKLAAILSADVAGYSRLMGADEEATIAALNACRAIFRDRVERHHGRVVDTAGDSVLSVFDSMVEAVRAAAGIQEALAARDSDQPEDRRMRFRIGVNLGDIVEQADGTIYGDGVNVAARLEALAEPGGICVSESAHMQVEGKLEAGFESIGAHAVKNIAKPIQAYRLVAPGAAPRPRSRRPLAWAAAAALVFVIAGVAVWQATKPPPTPETASDSADPILALPSGPSVAVLPFVSLSENRDDAFFAQGLSAEISNALTNYDLRVIGQDSTARIGQEFGSFKKIGADLGAEYLVSGKVMRSKERIRIQVQLNSATDEALLWGESFENDLSITNIFDVQNAIAQQVVATLADEYGLINRHAYGAARSKPPENLESYECVLVAFDYNLRLDSDTYARARRCLEHVVEVDPTYATAWAWLAEVLVDGVMLQWVTDPDFLATAMGRAEIAARRAVELESHNQRAHWALAYYLYHAKRHNEFMIEVERGLELNPNHAGMLGNFGTYLCYAGDGERGRALVEKAIALNPHYPFWWDNGISISLISEGQFEKALESAWRAYNAEPLFHYSPSILAIINAHLGNLEEAAKFGRETLPLYENYEAEAFTEWSRWIHDEHAVAVALEGLRMAGLNIPETQLRSQ